MKTMENVGQVSTFKRLLVVGVVVALVGGGGYWAYRPVSGGAEQCISDADCAVFGETGDCNCGCYHKNNIPSGTGGKCFCAAPTSCRCVDGECEGVFGEEYCHEMSLIEAQNIAVSSECGNYLEGQSMCNETTKTWWLDLNIEKEGCNPACVVNVETKQAEINWRCTGLIPE